MSRKPTPTHDAELVTQEARSILDVVTEGTDEKDFGADARAMAEEALKRSRELQKQTQLERAEEHRRNRDKARSL